MATVAGWSWTAACCNFGAAFSNFGGTLQCRPVRPFEQPPGYHPTKTALNANPPGAYDQVGGQGNHHRAVAGPSPYPRRRPRRPRRSRQWGRQRRHDDFWNFVISRKEEGEKEEGHQTPLMQPPQHQPPDRTQSDGCPVGPPRAMLIIKHPGNPKYVSRSGCTPLAITMIPLQAVLNY